MSKFLPDGYDKLPSTSRYMRLQDGKNTFRVLSSAITRWVYWNTSNKPVRLRDRPSGRPLDMRADEDESVKHFWAFVVWNYSEKMVQVLEVTQKQIMNGLKALVDDENWGDPKGYDISITRSGTGFDTEYVTQGIPSKPMDPKIAEEYAKQPVYLPALYESGDRSPASLPQRKQSTALNSANRRFCTTPPPPVKMPSQKPTETGLRLP